MSRSGKRPGQRSIPPAGILGSGLTRSRGFNCHACGSWFGVFQNVTELNAGHNAINAEQTFALECPTCTHADEYAASEIVELGASGSDDDPSEAEAP